MSRDPPLSRHWLGTQIPARDVRRCPPQWGELPRPPGSRPALFPEMRNGPRLPRARNRDLSQGRGGQGNSCTMPPCEPASPPAFAALSCSSPRFSWRLPALGRVLLPPWPSRLYLPQTRRVGPAHPLHKTRRSQWIRELLPPISPPAIIFLPLKNLRLLRKSTGV